MMMIYKLVKLGEGSPPLSINAMHIRSMHASNVGMVLHDYCMCSYYLLPWMRERERGRVSKYEISMLRMHIVWFYTTIACAVQHLYILLFSNININRKIRLVGIYRQRDLSMLSKKR